ncbi:acyltransferase [uncultured Tessaracoccus sp.]|uniref:acyltransferase family protein n=1 Tax=uncultured Tessaracoccus sp. TaxID=905023 RepID=UPI0025FCA239|nr:acyltransferase [uncultured Tessaracoccus sp.]
MSGKPRTQREVWIDVAKGMAIALVVLDHARHLLTLTEMPVHPVWSWVGETFASVRMPAFFMISGFFLFKWKERGWRAFVKGKVASFFYLYLVWATVYFVVDGLLVRHLDDRVLHLTRSGPIQHILRVDTPLWYLAALPVFSLVWWWTRTWPAWIPVTLASLGYFGTQWGVIRWPHLISTVFTIGLAHYLFAFLIGARATGIIRRLIPRAKPWHLLVTFTVWMLMVFFPPPLKGLLFFVSVPTLFMFAALVASSPRASRPFLLMGRRSLPIYVTHWLLIEVQLGITLRWIDDWPAWTGTFTTPLLWISSILIALGIWHATNAWHWLWARPDPDPVPVLSDVVDAPRVERPSGFHRLR